MIKSGALLYVREEKGEYFALDLGGTNLKVVWVKFGEDGDRRIVRDGMSFLFRRMEARCDVMFCMLQVDHDVREWSIPEECFDTDNGKLFEWMVEKAVEMIDAHRMGVEKHPVICGFCYSFACEQKNLDEGRQLLWTKSFRGKGLIGENVVEVLSDTFRRKGVDVKVPALMNDSVAALVGAKYRDPDTKVGVILGTGTNCAYIESVKNIKTLPEVYNKRGDFMIVNTEWGDAKLGGALPACEEDLWVDFSSANPGHGLFEKLISGLYVGDVARRVMLRIAEQTGYFGGYAFPAGSGLAKPQSFDGAHLSAVYHDDSEQLDGILEVFKDAFCIESLSYKERAIAKEICTMVTVRSAKLCAAAIAAVLRREFENSPTDDKIVVSVDGSMFTKFDGYQDLVRRAVDEILDGSIQSQDVEIKVADGSSVFGAAIVAAAVYSSNENK